VEALEFQKEARDAAQATSSMALSRMAEAVAKPNCDPEVAIKVYNATKDVAEAVRRDKENPFANLPVFHIHIVNGRMQGTAETDLELVEELDKFVASPAMLAMSRINADIGDEA
jgi:hypothetical protein